MAFKEYALPTIYIDNVLILDAQSIQMGNEENDNEIYNITEGFSGISLGTEIFRSSVESAVPRAGLPIPLAKYAMDRQVVDITIFVGDQSLSTKGYVKNVNISGSVDAPVSISFEMYGTPAYLK